MIDRVHYCAACRRHGCVREALAEVKRLREGYIDRSDDWPECRYCKAWAPPEEFAHKPDCILASDITALPAFQPCANCGDMPEGHALIRVAPEILAKLEAEGSDPVHVLGVERHEDGTLDLILRTPELVAEVERLREALSPELAAVAATLVDLMKNDLPPHISAEQQTQAYLALRRIASAITALPPDA